MNDSTPRKRNTLKQSAWRWTKRLVACVVLLVLFVFGWAMIHRMQADQHAVAVHRSETPQATEPTPDISASRPFTVVAYNIAHARGPSRPMDRASQTGALPHRDVVF